MPQPQPPSPATPFPFEPDVFNLLGFLRTQDFVPSAKPMRFAEQVVIVTAGGSSRLYIHDRIGAAWRYTTLT